MLPYHQMVNNCQNAAAKNERNMKIELACKSTGAHELWPKGTCMCDVSAVKNLSVHACGLKIYRNSQFDFYKKIFQ